MIKTTLLPFKGRIVYDGIIMGYNVSFGPGIKRSLNEGYKEAKAGTGIITTLPPPAVSLLAVAKDDSAGKRAAKAPKKSSKKTEASGSSAAAAARAAHDRIVTLIDDVCREHLDDEYATLGRKLAGVLARKRPSPLIRGKPESWASAIVRVIGWVNFIGDPSNPDHRRLSDIDKLFGISEATGAAKSMAIRNLLRIRRFDPEWTLPSRMVQNPLPWMIEVNGLIADARHLPRHVQESAFRRGLIPFIPGDQADEADD
jgi:hypothetical protein